MKRLKNIALTTLAMAGLCSTGALASDAIHLTDHFVAGKSYAQYAKSLSPEKRVELERYLEHQKRQPCQNYRPVPEGFVKEGCNLRHKAEKKAPVKAEKQAAILKQYEVHFELDEAQIEPAAGNTLSRVDKEIRRYNPSEVTVSGHTDTVGPASYNAKLAKKRAMNVSDALTDKGVKNRVLNNCKSHNLI